jgi:hypothetical protein
LGFIKKLIIGFSEETVQVVSPEEQLRRGHIFLSGKKPFREILSVESFLEAKFY